MYIRRAKAGVSRFSTGLLYVVPPPPQNRKRKRSCCTPPHEPPPHEPPPHELRDVETVFRTQLGAGSPVFLLALAEDYVRHCILARALPQSAGKYATHLPRALWEALWGSESEPPLLEDWRELCAPKQQRAPLLDTLHTRFPVFVARLRGILPAAEARYRFWMVVLRFCATLECVSPGSQDVVRVTWDDACGFGLQSVAPICKGAAVPGVWGEVLPLSHEERGFFQGLALATSNTLLAWGSPPRYAVIIGTIELLNSACDACFNVYAAPASEVARGPVDGCSEWDWKEASARRDIRANHALAVQYGTTYELEACAVCMK